MSRRTATVRFDGASKPHNPGGTGVYGFSIETNDGEELVDGGVIGRDDSMTSNMAEYYALREAIETAISEFEPDHIHAIGDSELVINTMRGEWQARSPSIEPFHEYIDQIVTHSDTSFQFQHVPRDQNEVAHEQCEIAYRNHLYREERETALETSMEVIAQGRRKYDVDGHTVSTEHTTCTCSTYEEHGGYCEHIFKVQFLEDGRF